MEITHHKQSGSGRFVMMDNQTQAGELIYDLQADSAMVTTHTLVDKDYQGRGIARLLVDAAIAYARAEQLKIVPQCSYVRARFEKDDSIQDVLQK